VYFLQDAKVSSKDIWAILEAMSTSSNLSNNNTAKEDQVQPQELANEEKDTYTLIVGSKSSGKSSLIQTFRNSTKGTSTIN
jgi:predicted GTPase